MDARRQGERQEPARSRAIAILCALLLFGMGGIFVYCWIASMGVHWLMIGIANALAGLWYVGRNCRFRSSNNGPGDISSGDRSRLPP